VERILVIDADPEVQRAVRHSLEPAGYTVVPGVDGCTAMTIFRATVPRLVVLDIRLPGKSGEDICREIRNESTSVPILVLSAASEEIDKVLLLELGADDYITKPFSPRELLARVQAAIRRTFQNPSSERFVFRFDDVEVNLTTMQIYRHNAATPLTTLEYRFLRLFLHSANRVIPTAEVLAVVWDDPVRRSSHAVRAHVSHLRRKLERDPAYPVRLITVHGVGYKFVLWL
jgi:two-component system alkaline phosphatase synthesis response regulator PhoP